MDVKSRNGEKFEIFLNFLAHRVETPWPTDLDGSTPECAQVCAVHIGLHLASLRKIEMVAVLCTNETPQFFEILTPPPPPPGTDGHHRGRGHVGRHCPYINNIWCRSVSLMSCRSVSSMREWNFSTQTGIKRRSKILELELLQEQSILTIKQ